MVPIVRQVLELVGDYHYDEAVPCAANQLGCWTLAA